MMMIMISVTVFTIDYFGNVGLHIRVVEWEFFLLLSPNYHQILHYQHPDFLTPTPIFLKISD